MSTPEDFAKAWGAYRQAQRTGERRWWELRQNNSYGRFEPPCIHLVIEACSPEHARDRALSAGAYFDGVAAGKDCGCCGDRWYAPSGNGDPVAMISGQPAAQYKHPVFKSDAFDIPITIILPLDGPRVELNNTEDFATASQRWMAEMQEETAKMRRDATRRAKA